jgi:enamine deaminase RidA (YjgF/YER057c/UK114 family)/catechol 2,3-dioxygenase-like lactoylglutathione lyase family enzyme
MKTKEAPAAPAQQSGVADIGHVHLRVTDLERSLRFYTQTIGMSIVLRQPKHAFLAFGDYHHHLALDARGDFGGRSEDADGRAGLHHFAIRFSDEQALRTVVDRLQALGAQLKGADFTALRAVFTRDPDGNQIELSCDRPRESWPPNWASVEGIGRWRPLDPSELSAGGDDHATTTRRAATLERRIVNPWEWQSRVGFDQAHEVRGSERLLFCSGVVSVDAEGTPQHVGDMREQALLALDNLEAILREAGFGLADVVRLTTYVTDMGAYWEARPAIRERLDAAGCRHTSTLLGVSSLARPELLIEIEATAAK